MAAWMIQETSQDASLQIYTSYKRPSLIQALFAGMSTEVDVGRIVQSTNVDNKNFKLDYILREKQNVFLSIKKILSFLSFYLVLVLDSISYNPGKSCVFIELICVNISVFYYRKRN